MNNKLHFFIYFIIFLTPIYLLRFSIFYIPTNILEVMIAFLFLIWIAKKLLFKNLLYNLKSEIINNKLLYIGIFLLFIGLVLSTIKSDDILSSIGIIKSWFIIPLLFYILVKSALKNENKKIKVLYSFLFSGILISLISFIYFLSGNLTYDNRLKAFYEHPNMLSIILSITLIILFIVLFNKLKFYLNKKSKIKKALIISSLLIYICLLIFIIYMTASLGALIGVILALLFCFLYFILKKQNINYILYIIIAIGILLPFLSVFTDPWNMERDSTSSRLMVWQSSVKIIKNNFILGIGPADFQNKYLEYQKYFKPYLEWAFPHPHNIFISTWLMSGLLGITGFVLVLLNVFKKIANNKFQISSFVVIAILIYLLIHGFVDNTIWKNDLSIIFWFLIAII